MRLKISNLYIYISNHLGSYRQRLAFNGILQMSQLLEKAQGVIEVTEGLVEAELDNDEEDEEILEVPTLSPNNSGTRHENDLESIVDEDQSICID